MPATSLGGDVSNRRSVDVSLSVVLFLIFLVLKLTEVITWSWLWVTAPLWIPAVLGLGIILIGIIIGGIAALLGSR